VSLLWPKEKAFEWIKLHKMVAIVRARNAAIARGTAEALLKGGFKLIEVSLSVPGGLDVIREFSGRTGVLVGAGSVLSEKTAKHALDAGAQFLAAPVANDDVFKLAKRAKVLHLCGALTPTEVVAAWSRGADMVRVFPVRSVGGAAYVQALKELLPEVPLVASGGVTLENLRDYFLSGATAVGMAGGLLNEQAVDNARWGDVTQHAKRFQEAVQRL
jgi:2-dehydro-3-deoxyphosphogluconate aldolase / (4S)-4-hydroxy-2-oxoglutarate aldolase